MKGRQCPGGIMMVQCCSGQIGTWVTDCMTASLFWVKEVIFIPKEKQVHSFTRQERKKYPFSLIFHDDDRCEAGLAMIYRFAGIYPKNPTNIIPNFSSNWENDTILVVNRIYTILWKKFIDDYMKTKINPWLAQDQTIIQLVLGNLLYFINL